MSQGQKRGFTVEEAAQYVGMSKNWLNQARLKEPDPGPNWKRIGAGRGRIVYLKEDLDSWLESQEGGGNG